MKAKKEAKVKVWNIRDNFGQSGQVRLTREGRLEIKNNGQRVWRLIKLVDISLFSDKDVENALKSTEGIIQVKRG